MENFRWEVHEIHGVHGVHVAIRSMHDSGIHAREAARHLSTQLPERAYKVVFRESAYQWENCCCYINGKED